MTGPNLRTRGSAFWAARSPKTGRRDIYRTAITRLLRGFSALATSLVCALLMVGCTGTAATEGGGSAPPSSADADKPYNAEDLHFAQTLFSHHDQAIAMSTTIIGNAGVDAEVKAIAGRIEAAHKPQFELVESWAWAFGLSAERPTEAEVSHHEVRDGLMNEKEMEALDNAVGDAAEILYLDGMMRHHQGAVALAQAELASGKHPDARALAQAVADNDLSELQTLHGLREQR